MPNRKVLLLGGAGSMGSYLAPKLLELGYQVDIAGLIVLNKNIPDHPHLRYISGDFKELENLKKLLANNYDGIIDFLDYNAAAYQQRYRLFAENCKHYIFLSSYRVYNGKESPAREDSPRYLDQCDNEEFRFSDDYSIYKARDEDILRASGFDNWTIVRPSIIFSSLSLPLCPLGAWHIYNRAKEGKPTILPDQAIETFGCATWSGDIAKLFAGVLFNPKCYTETYTFATAESQTWGTWAEYYKELVGLQTWTVDLEAYKEIFWNNAEWSNRMLIYDRLVNRVMDNSKILAAVGMTQSDMTPVFDALKFELERLPEGFMFPGDPTVNSNMDAYLAAGGRIIRKF